MRVGNELGFPTYLLCHHMSCVLLAKGRREKTGLVAGVPQGNFFLLVMVREA